MTRITIARRTPLLLASCAALALAACDQPMDFDLRGAGGGFSTAQSVQTVTADRPTPDSRGVISYPSYQVAVARRGDTLTDVANRVGLPAAEVASFNGIDPDVTLRAGEIVALPRRVAEPTGGTGAIRTSRVDVTTLAGNAIDNAAPTPVTSAPAASPTTTSTLPPSGQEPIRHQVERGETAFTIARLYQVPVKSLAEWNGLGADYAIREGQYLLIPIARVAPPANTTTSATTAPGTGSPTPTPPSAAKPLPEDDTANAPAIPPPTEPVADVGQSTSTARMALPVQGSIIRGYSKGRNEGLDIKAAPGTPVKAAADGTVAAITQSGDGVPIIVVRHVDNILTVYANVDAVQVEKGDRVSRGQSIASLRETETDAYVHFEVRDGFDSVDPAPFLE